MPLVSVIMSSYNYEFFISEAIQSVLNQSVNDIELIIVDDGSNDHSKEIIENYRSEDGRIIALFHKTNMGIAKTMNDGIEKAKGKFIAFIDSDDVWVKDKLEKQMKVLELNEDLVVWSEGDVVDKYGKSKDILYTNFIKAPRKKSGDIFEELLKWDFIFLSSIIFKKKNIKQVRFNEALKCVNDYQFITELARDFQIFIH